MRLEVPAARTNAETQLVGVFVRLTEWQRDRAVRAS